MDLTRSKPQEADTENAARFKAPTKVTSAKSGASMKEELARKDKYWAYRRILPTKRIVALPRSSGKYYDMLDIRMLAMGIFIDTMKEERLKNDPHFTFTREFYSTVIHDFDALNDDNKAWYFDEANKRNTIEDNYLASKRVVKGKKTTTMDCLANVAIEGKAVTLYFAAVKAEHFKNKPEEPYDPKQFSFFQDLKSDEERQPYLAEATVRQLEETTVHWMRCKDDSD